MTGYLYPEAIASRNLALLVGPARTGMAFLGVEMALEQALSQGRLTGDELRSVITQQIGNRAARRAAASRRKK